MKQENLERLIQELIDGCISPQELTSLEEELQSNPGAMAYYIAYTDLDNLMHVQTEIAHNNSSKVVPIDKIIRRQKRRSHRIALFSAAAILLIGLITMQLFLVRGKAPTLSFEISPGTQYVLTHSGMNEAPEGLTLEKGSRLKLSQGTVELTFESGVKSIVMAPADMTLHDDDTLFLNKGTAWFQVPKGAEGFEVITKDLTIVDLGTEFGVIAKPNNHHEVHVLKGKVQVTAKRVRKESAELVAGEARRSDPVGRLKTIPTNSKTFATTLPTTLPYVHWSFDHEDGIQATGTHPIAQSIRTYSKSPPIFISGHQGEAISIARQGHPLKTNWQGITGDQARTVSLWFKLTKNLTIEKEIPALLYWGNNSRDNTKWKIGLLKARVPDATVIRLSFGADWFNTSTDVADGQWHHCAVIYRGTPQSETTPDFDVFIDGHRETLHHFSYQGDVRTTPALLAKVDTQPKTDVTLGASREYVTTSPFPGALDEITIFDGAIPEHQIPSLYDGSLIRK